jgi:hypothetical protein
MSLSSFRLGVILIGIGTLLLGLRLQQKTIQGFQSGSLPANPLDVKPPVIKMPSPTDFADNPAFTAIDDTVNSLIMKDIEIRNKYKLITANKTSSDLILTKTIDANALFAIEILYNEVSDYINKMSKFKETYIESSLEQRKVLSQLVYTISDQVNILYYIYYTYPSTIISTDTIMKSDSAQSFDVTGEPVLSQSKNSINSILSSLPSPSSKIDEYYNKLLNSAKTVSKDQSAANIKDFTETYTQFKSITELQQTNLSTILGNTNLTYLPTVATDKESYKKISTALNNKIDFMKQILDLLQSILTILLMIQSPSEMVKSAIDTLKMDIDKNKTNLSPLTVQLTAIDVSNKSQTPPSTKTEPFVSYMNPYNQPSPNTSQAYQFRLEKKAYADRVFDSMRI